MPLFKIADFNPNYRQEAFDGEDVKGLDVYAGKTDEKIGTIHDVLVDETGRFRYFVVDTGFWIFGKQVLLPVGRCHVDVTGRRLYAIGIATKAQAERLPAYDDSMVVDYDYEERVRGVYRTPTVETTRPLEASPPLESSGVAAVSAPKPRPVPHPRKSYAYEQEPSLYQMNEQEHQKLRLYEERLIANKSRRQAGEVTIGKRVEIDTARASVPVEKERVVIERTTPGDVGATVTPGDAVFHEGEVAHMRVYEETANISKQPFVREEVNIRKEVEQKQVNATETLRREELEVDVNGNPVVTRRYDDPI